MTGPASPASAVLASAGPSDLPRLVELDLQLFRADAWREGAWREELARDPGGVVVARAAGVPVGYGVIVLRPGTAEVYRIGTDPAHRGQGIGRRILTELVDRARRAGCREVLLEVAATNGPARALYLALGFTDVARRPGYYERGTTDAVTMRLDLAATGHGPLVLGIETSCDETGIAIVSGRTLLADAVASSVAEHVRFGGVVPEVASRAHLEALVPGLERACREAGVGLADVDAIAVTAGPGLASALLVGVAAAKALALALDRPLYGVNHLVAHVAVSALESGPLPEPCVALLVSGGHSSLLLVEDITGAVTLLGSTLDDAAGEAYDKVARLLGLPYPGGLPIDRAAADGDPEAVRFPRALTLPRDRERHRFDFSFSGLKTAVARWTEAGERDGRPVRVADVAASFQEAVCDVLSAKAVDACQEYGSGHLLIGGGVAANSRLRALAEQRCAQAGIALRVPSPRLCTDNGAMVAALGAELVMRGRPPSSLDLPADSSMPVTRVRA